MDPLTPESQAGFSFLGLIAHADPVVQTVVAILVLSSVASWAIIIAKSVRLAALSRDIGRLEGLADGQSREVPEGLPKDVLGVASEEIRDIALDRSGGGEARARLIDVMRDAAQRRLKGLERGLPFLATVGSAAPFVGLFGTVWGIMHSFTSIAQAKDTSLAVVAPGIAEALFATAVGLFAAIPAVVAYNQFATAMGRAADRIAACLPGLARVVLSRQRRPEAVEAVSR